MMPVPLLLLLAGISAVASASGDAMWKIPGPGLSGIGASSTLEARLPVLPTAEERAAVAARRVLRTPERPGTWLQLARQLEELQSAIPWRRDPGLQRAIRLAKATATSALGGSVVTPSKTSGRTMTGAGALVVGLFLSVGLRRIYRKGSRGDGDAANSRQDEARAEETFPESGSWKLRATSLASHGMPADQIARRMGLSRDAVRLLVTTGRRSTDARGRP